MSEAWTIGRVVRWAADDFRTRGIESPRLEAELLLAVVLRTDRMRIIVESERPLVADELSRYKQAIQRRRKGEPIAYIVGEKEFYGRMFRIDRRVLVPRPDTETLVEVALRRTTARSMGARYLDLCTGSGCVAISLARERNTCKVSAVDISADAVAVARENAIRLGALPQTAFYAGDLFAPLSPAERFDLITANPPYIPTPDIAHLVPDIRDFEPRVALAGGDDGLTVMRRLVAEAPRRLRQGGVLAVEMQSDQADAVRALFTAAGFTSVAIDRDYGAHERVASGAVP